MVNIKVNLVLATVLFIVVGAYGAGDDTCSAFTRDACSDGKFFFLKFLIICFRKQNEKNTLHICPRTYLLLLFLLFYSVDGRMHRS